MSFESDQGGPGRRRKHHCRRCGRLVCNDASVLGPPQDQDELEAALRQVRKTRRLTLRSDPHSTIQGGVSSDEEDPEPIAAAATRDTEQPTEGGVFGIRWREVDTAGAKAQWEELQLSRLRRCITCAQIDGGSQSVPS